MEAVLVVAILISTNCVSADWRQLGPLNCPAEVAKITYPNRVSLTRDNSITAGRYSMCVDPTGRMIGRVKMDDSAITIWGLSCYNAGGGERARALELRPSDGCDSSFPSSSDRLGFLCPADVQLPFTENIAQQRQSEGQLRVQQEEWKACLNRCIDEARTCQIRAETVCDRRPNWVLCEPGRRAGNIAEFLEECHIDLRSCRKECGAVPR